MSENVNDVIVPYVNRVHDDLGVDDGQAALALFDHFVISCTILKLNFCRKFPLYSISAVQSKICVIMINRKWQETLQKKAKYSKQNSKHSTIAGDIY